MGRHRILEHPADVGFHAEGSDWADALDAAVAALADIQTGGAAPHPDGRREVALDADTDEELVVALLEECLFLVDAEDWLATGARVVADGDGWRATLSGASIGAGDRENGVHVKAITWHQLAVARGEGRVDSDIADGVTVRVTVFVDI